jgi:hypothetical protein
MLMSFLYPAFLIGMAAIALPIVLHLLRRDVAPEVPFTAVHLLRRSPIERSRRRRLRDLLLLAARVAALLLLATAFARPYKANATARSGLLIIGIDRSYSMSVPGRFSRALELARDAIAEAGTAQVAVVAFDERAELVAGPTSGADARGALTQLQVGFGATRYPQLIAKAVELANHAPARLVIVTDLQRVGWEEEQPIAIPSDLAVELLDTGATASNVTLVNARVGQPDSVIATIQNSAGRAFSGTVRLALAAREVAAAPVTVPSAGRVDLRVGYRAPSSGALTVSIDDPQGMLADNTRYLALDPVPRPRVLIVTATGPGSQSGFYVARAIDAAAGEDDAFDVRLVAGPTFATMKPEELSRHAAVVLLSTRGLDRRVRDTLGAFVRSGGGLMVAAAPDVEPSVLSMVLDWKPPLTAVEQEGHPLAATDLRHPVFRPFGSLAANLGQVRFDRTWRVRPDGWDVAASFVDGTPALLERADGTGRVVLFTSDLDKRWNDFPLHAAFVPFALESLRYVIGQQPRSREYSVASAPAGVPAQPGVYRLAGDRVVAINVDPREGAVARITADEFKAMLQRVDVTSRSEVARAQQTEARQSYWRYGLVLMLVTLIVESFMGRAG